MPAFRYEAADALGKTDRGVIEADSPRQARSQLRARADAADGRSARRRGPCSAQRHPALYAPALHARAGAVHAAACQPGRVGPAAR
ncbi:hypothetical protein ACTMU2_35190 [Cupriavidus basilensis]